MARVVAPETEPRPRLRLTLDGHGPALAAGVVVASAVLVGPIVLWARLGHGDPLRAVAVGIAATTVGYGVFRMLSIRPSPVTAAYDPLPRAPVAVAPDARRDHQSPPHAARPSRDGNCSAVTRSVARRTSRRRTHP
jgi:hypothetical protein